MRKNSFTASFLSLLLSFGTLFLLALLYWSSLLVEEDLKSIKKDLNEMKLELASKNFTTTAVQEKPSFGHQGKHVDPKLPNLLTEDPFYEKTLPNMLGKDFKPKHLRKQATIGKPDNLHPFSNFAEASSWRSACSLAVSKGKIGFFEEYAPSGAFKIEERKGAEDTIEYWVHLREGLFWQPLEKEWFPENFTLAPHFFKKHPLTAYDFKLYYDVALNPFVSNPLAVQLRNLYDDILGVDIIDDYTFVVKWKTHEVTMSDGKKSMQPKYLAKSVTLSFSPFASFLYLYYPDGKKIVENDVDPDTYRTNSTFAQIFSEHWAKNIIPSCGPFKFKGMSDRMLKMERNSDYFDPLACLISGVEVEFKSAQENIWQAFKQGSLDTYSLQADQAMEFSQFLKSAPYLAQEKEGSKINRLDYVFRAFTYIGWNEARPLFKSNKVRQALTIAIDRNRIINQILNGMGIEMSSPFYPFSDSYDPSIKPWPFDPALAKRLLEEEGFFDLDGDGIIEKKIDGKIIPFEFSLTYFVKVPATKAICEYISTALKEVGIRCNLNGVDLADISALFDDKNFDAYYLAWALGDPPEDLRQIWHSSGAKEKGSPNSIGFINPEVDRIIEALEFEYNREKRIQLYHQFAKIFHEEQPYTLLFTPRVAMLYRNYLQNVFLPIDRQDLIPGAVTAEPEPSLFWIKK